MAIGSCRTNDENIPNNTDRPGCLRGPCLCAVRRLAPRDLLVGGGCADCNGDILMHHYDLEREMLRQIFNNTAKPIETIQEIECGTCLEAWGRDDCPYSFGTVEMVEGEGAKVFE